VEMPPEDLRVSAARLVNLIQVLAVNEPRTLRLVERTVLTLVAEQRRQRISEDLETLDAEALATIGGVIDRLKGNLDTQLSPPAAAGAPAESL
jgi:hypothetical protein